MELPNTSLSTDAVPMSPRELHATVEPTEDFNEIPEPHPDWQFNIFLDNIADGITSEEFQKMKHLFRGHGGISDLALNEMMSVLDLFSIMRTRRLLSRDNLIYLQAMLYKLGRVDLTKQGVEYANTIGNVIHFYPASALPENGFRYAKVHVEGRNFRNCTRGYVQSIRNIVAKILFMPAEFVVIAGVEPSSSLLITLMIPDLYATILEELLDDGLCSTELKELSIDIVELNKVYNVGDDMDRANVNTDQQKKLATIYEQFELKSKQLEDSELERLRLSSQLGSIKRQVSELETNHFHDEAMIGTLKTEFVRATDSPSQASISSECALKEFESALNQVKVYDKDILRKLISSNTTVVANRLKDMYSIRQKQLELAVEDLQSQLVPIRIEMLKYRFFSGLDVDEMDKNHLERQLLQSSAKVSVKVELSEEILQILKKISKSLRNHEREKLAKKYTWDPDEKVEHTVDSDQSCFLVSILEKEINESLKVVHIEQFISQCLEDVGRIDLKKKFHDLLKGMTRNTAKPKGKRSTPQKQRSGHMENSSEHDEQFQLLNKVADQVQIIYDAFQENKKSFASEFGVAKDFILSYDQPPYVL